MALTIEHVKRADERIRKKFGNVQRASAEFHFVADTKVKEEYDKVFPGGGTPAGFVDYKSNPFQVWITYNNKDEAVVVHETMHLYGMWYKQTFPERFGTNINEGVTEYLTRQIVSERRLSYTAEYAEIEAAVQFTGGDFKPMCQAFFQGCFATWQGAMGLLTFVKWEQQMRAANWKPARDVLRNPPDKPKAVACKRQS